MEETYKEEEDVLNDLFRFPIISADGEIERKKRYNKEKYGNLMNKDEDEEELEVVHGWAEYPYNLFLGLADRWLPTDESFRRAQDGDFEACYVTFSGIGSFIVPWTRDKFKSEYNEFVKEFNRRVELKKTSKEETKEDSQIPIIILQQFKDKQDE